MQLQLACKSDDNEFLKDRLTNIKIELYVT